MEIFAKPFQKMAISLSGGGYRATTFHLGALAYLNSLEYDDENLLKRVKVISTISGGTLTGVMYALYMAKGRTFEECYSKIHALLKEDKLLERAFNKLNNTKHWHDTNKTKDLINAFAEVYDEFFYEREHFDTLYDSDKSHLHDIIFGSTEFTDGIQFRFQENHDNGKFGNYYLNLPDEVAKRFRLADAAASSSCFPGGFEPMIMPKDYANNKNDEITKAWEEKKHQVTGIMDGGIIDNQGIEGVKLAEQRRETKTGGPYIGTYFISDVSGKTMAPFNVPKFELSEFWDFFSLSNINRIVGLILVGLIALMFFTSLPLWGTIVASSVVTLLVTWFILFYFIKNTFLSTLTEIIGKNNSPKLFDDFSVFTKTPVYILAYLIKIRALSVIKMVSDIFLRRIRSLQLTSLFSHSEWNYRIKTNNIYTLHKKEGLGKKMTDVIEAANHMGTTLWFSDQQRKDNTLDKLIACGQFTLCYNLTTYIERIKKKEDLWSSLTDKEKNDIEGLNKKCLADFEKFKIDPFWLVKKLNTRN